MATSQEQLPAPRELEEKEEYLKRFTASPRLKVTHPNLTPYGKRQMGEAQWEAARLRSYVRIKNSEGEWLLF